MPRCFENGNGDFGPEAFRAILRTTKHKWSSGFMVLDVSYSRVLGQRPTFYCPFFYEKQAIRRNRLRCFHVWFVSDRWQWVAPRFGRVCTGSLLVFTIFITSSLPGFARVPSLSPALPHCLWYFLKLYNVLNDNVYSRSVKFSGITSPIRPPTLRNTTSSNVER